MTVRVHPERHFTGGQVVRDVVIGMADGLTVPFALIAGLSGAFNSTTIVIVGGLAEIAAGGIAMGLGGYLAAKGEADHYDSELRRERREIEEMPADERDEIVRLFAEYGLTEPESRPIADALSRRPEAFADFMMRFELGLERPRPRRAIGSALTIGLAYVLGGFVPLSPYFAAGSAAAAFLYSVLVTAAALLVFGAVKGRFTGLGPLRSAFQTLIIGGIASGTAYLIARAV